MSLLGTVAGVSNGLQMGGAALSLVGMGAALVKPKELQPGIAGVVFGKRPNFDIITSDRLSLASEITDHYTEDNYAIQDHIAFRPAVIAISGIVSELVFTKSEIEKAISAVFDRLAPLGILNPAVSASAQKYLSEANRLKSAIESAITQVSNVAGAFGVEDAGVNKQQWAYRFFKNLYDTRAIVSVETPWDTWPSMAIENIEFEQGEETKGQTTITVTFKEIRVVETAEGDKELTGKIKAQAAPVEDKGNARGEKKEIKQTALKKIINPIKPGKMN